MNRRGLLRGAAPLAAIVYALTASAGSISFAEEVNPASLWNEPLGAGVHPASYLQPPPMGSGRDDETMQPMPRTQPGRTTPAQPPRRTPSPFARFARSTGDTTWRSSALSRRPVTRLASIPKMFGDYGPERGMLRMYDMNSGMRFSADLASAGVGQRLKVLENNNALPDDRIYFQYRHFHNSLRSTPDLTSPNINKVPVDSYTLGYERSFFDGLTSVQLVMPFLGTPTLYSAGGPFTDNFVSGGNVGNFGVIFKGLFYQNGRFALSGGMSLNTPTGSSVDGRAFNTAFHIDNRAFQLAPFGAFIWAPQGPWLSNFYLLGGVQYDMVTGGNPLTGNNALAGFNGPLMQLVDSNLLFSDLACGAFLYENPGAPLLRAVAGQVELHHAWSTTPHYARAMAGTNQFTFGAATDRIDALNITGGLRFMLMGNAVLSVGAVAPLHAPLFDAEVQAVTSIFL